MVLRHLRAGRSLGRRGLTRALDLFLSGGGGIGPEFDGFLEAARRSGRRRILVIVAGREDRVVEANALGYRDAFRARGVPIDESDALRVSAQEPLSTERLRERDPTALFVSGGLTPLYREGLCRDRGWCDWLEAEGLPYAGFSAGAAIAADRALLGGWRVERDGRPLQVVAREVGEELDLVEVQRGLGLVPFAVDAHAAQWGTLSRAVHAVERGLVAEAVALDESTVLQVTRDDPWGAARVHGEGVAYRVRRADAQATGGVRVDCLTARAGRT